MNPETEKYYTDLFGPLESEIGATGVAGVSGIASKGLFSKMKGVAKANLPSLIGMLLLDRILSVRNAAKDRGLQMEAIKKQSEMVSPENLYYQAALPQAQQEEEMARNALLTQLTGGVIGPTLAKGERLIGG
jgi:hypothetical protein